MRGAEFPREVQLEGYNTAFGGREIWEREGIVSDTVNTLRDKVFDLRKDVSNDGVGATIKKEVVGVIESAVENKVIFGATLFVAGVGAGVLLKDRQIASS